MSTTIEPTAAATATEPKSRTDVILNKPVDSLTEEDKWHIRQILKGNIPAPDDTWKMGAELWETTKQLVTAREKLLAAEQHLNTVSMAQLKVIKAITNERVRGAQVLGAIRAVKWEIKALDCDLALLYDRAFDDESAKWTDDDYEPSEVTDGDEKKDKDVPKNNVAAIVVDKEEKKNKDEVVDKKEGQDKNKEQTQAINQGKEGDDEDDLVIIDAADQPGEEDKQADKVIDPEASTVEQQTVVTERTQEDSKLDKQSDEEQTDKISEEAQFEPTKQLATAAEVDSPPATKAKSQNNTVALHSNQITSLPAPRPAGEINLEMFKYSTDVWYRAHRDIIELHKELFRADPAAYMKHCTPPWVESLPPPIPGDTAGFRPGLFSDSDGV